MNQLQKYLSANGRKGGSVKSEAKSRASRRNGKLGGRPKGLIFGAKGKPGLAYPQQRQLNNTHD